MCASSGLLDLTDKLKALLQLLRLTPCVRLRFLTLSVRDPHRVISQNTWDEVATVLLSVQSAYLEKVNLRIAFNRREERTTLDEKKITLRQLEETVLKLRTKSRTIAVTILNLKQEGTLNEDFVRSCLPRLQGMGILRFESNVPWST